LTAATPAEETSFSVPVLYHNKPDLSREKLMRPDPIQASPDAAGGDDNPGGLG
jgi:hypothetical protein